MVVEVAMEAALKFTFTELSDFNSIVNCETHIKTFGLTISGFSFSIYVV